MIERLVSCGETGAAQAILDASWAYGITIGGWVSKGWTTEAVPAPWLARWGFVECPEPGDVAPPRAIVQDSDGTIWFGSIDAPGFTAAHDAALVLRRPFLIVYRGATRPSHVAAWIKAEGVRTLNVAGVRESVAPGIGARTLWFLGWVFLRLGHRPVELDDD